MAQPSVAAYFNTRKRAAVEQIERSAKVLLLNESDIQKEALNNLEESNVNYDVIFKSNSNTVADILNSEEDKCFDIKRKKIVTKLTFDQSEMTVSPKVTKKPVVRARTRKSSTDAKQQSIQKMFENMETKKDLSTQLTQIKEEEACKDVFDNTSIGEYPTTPTKKKSTMEQINSSRNSDLSVFEIKKKLTRSSRLSELKASISKINKTAAKLDELEKETKKIQPLGTASLKTFSTIELNIPASPQKVSTSPLKPYLSPSKVQTLSPRKNLFGSPVKETSSTSSPTKLAAFQRFASLAEEKPSLTLPFKYRCFAEIFRCLDSVVAMYFNRGEIITFKKIKPAVQELLRKNFTELHLEQIKSIYPDSYEFSQEKVRNFGSTSKQEKYELVVTPAINAENSVKCAERMSSTLLLDRRRKLYNLLIEKVKDYHEEFLLALEQPMVIPREKLTRWHPEFNIEKVPDLSRSPLPQPPDVEKLSTAKDILSKARNLFNCNTRMEKALERLAENKAGDTEKKVDVKIEPSSSILKGIPASLLEKVRARQAAKALETMTRAPAKDKEAAKYAQLPELAKFTRNIFVSERKSVLPLENVVNKLNNSFKTSFIPSEIENLLRLLSQLLPDWIIFHEIRKTVFVKLSKDTDMGKILSKLQKLAENKANT